MNQRHSESSSALPSQTSQTSHNHLRESPESTPIPHWNDKRRSQSCFTFPSPYSFKSKVRNQYGTKREILIIQPPCQNKLCCLLSRPSGHFTEQGMWSRRHLCSYIQIQHNLYQSQIMGMNRSEEQVYCWTCAVWGNHFAPCYMCHGHKIVACRVWKRLTW